MQETDLRSASIGDDPAQAYARVLADYFTTRGEDALYRASLLSRSLIENGLGPEEIVALHAEAIERASATLSDRERARAATDGLQFLLEVMIAYGVQYRRYLELRGTERERVSEAGAVLARQRAVAAEGAAREKTDFLAVVAHELRTPLTVAQGSVDLAIRQVQRERWERIPHALGAARDAIGRLTRLTEDLVEASRGEIRRVQLVPLDAAPVAFRACEWALPAAEAKGVTLACRVGSEPMPVLGDEDGLLMVFSNLLSNAVRYTDAGGRVELRAGRDGSACWIDVADTGIGMTAEVRERIFDDFFRADEARTRDGSGLGVGLALARRIVATHGGRIEVESEHGRGSTFRVILPTISGDASERDASGEASEGNA